jgi:hypothetical protein
MNLLLCSLVVRDATRINNPRVVRSASFGSQRSLQAICGWAYVKEAQNDGKNHQLVGCRVR